MSSNIDIVVREHAHLIRIAMESDIKNRKEQIESAKKTLAGEHNDGSDPYKSLESLVEYAEMSLADIEKAYQALYDINLFGR